MPFVKGILSLGPWTKHSSNMSCARRRRATISTTRAAEKSVALSFLNKTKILRQFWTSRRVNMWWRYLGPPSRGASIYVNFGCPNDVFLSILESISKPRSRRAQKICLWMDAHIIFYKWHCQIIIIPITYKQWTYMLFLDQEVPKSHMPVLAFPYKGVSHKPLCVYNNTEEVGRASKQTSKLLSGAHHRGCWEFW